MKLSSSINSCPESLAFGSHCSANFQTILNFFIPNFKLKYEDSENITADLVNTIVNICQIKQRNVSGTPGKGKVVLEIVLHILESSGDTFKLLLV